MSNRRSEKYLAVDLPEKVPQPHGGALYRGGVLGHKGGPGRPTNLAKQLAREAVEDLIPRMEKIAMGEELVARVRRKNSSGAPIEMEQTPEIKDQIRAFEALAKLAKEPTTIKAASGEMAPEGAGGDTQ